MPINMSFQSIQTDHRVGVWTNKSNDIPAEPHYHELFEAESVPDGMDRLKACAAVNGWNLSQGQIAVMIARANAARGGNGTGRSFEPLP